MCNTDTRPLIERVEILKPNNGDLILIKLNNPSEENIASMLPVAANIKQKLLGLGINIMVVVCDKDLDLEHLPTQALYDFGYRKVEPLPKQEYYQDWYEEENWNG